MRYTLLASSLLVVAFLAGCSGQVPSSAISGVTAGAQGRLQNPRPAASPTMRLYVGQANGSGDGSILSFDLPSNSGDIAPHQNIAGSNTELSGPLSVALGPADYIYAVQGGISHTETNTKVLQFSPAATGNATPNLTINTKPQGCVAQALTVDGSGHLWVVGHGLSGSSTSAILEYAKNASGGATPIKVISGSNTQLYLPDSIALDAAGNIWVANVGPVTGEPHTGLLEFSPSASGNVAPAAEISGSKTDLNAPWQITIDQSSYGNGRMLVADVGSHTYGRVLIFAPGASGNVAPSTEISSVQNPAGIVTDTSGYIYVSATLNSTIQEFKPDASGNATPIFTIKGSNTDLVSPFNLYLRNL